MNTCETCRSYRPGTGGRGRCVVDEFSTPNRGIAYPTDSCDFYIVAATRIRRGFTVRECEDCEEPMKTNERRIRCGRCKKLVCGWCIHHVHNSAVQNVIRRRA